MTSLAAREAEKGEARERAKNVNENIFRSYLKATESQMLRVVA